MKKEKGKHATPTKKLSYTLLILGVGCILLGLFLGFRYTRTIRRMPQPRPRQTNVSLIQPWMTLPYIARTYRVPERILIQAVQADPVSDRRSSLEKIAQEEEKNSSAVVSEVQKTITNYQKSHPVSPSQGGPAPSISPQPSKPSLPTKTNST